MFLEICRSPNHRHDSLLTELELYNTRNEHKKISNCLQFTVCNLMEENVGRSQAFWNSSVTKWFWGKSHVWRGNSLKFERKSAFRRKMKAIFTKKILLNTPNIVERFDVWRLWNDFCQCLKRKSLHNRFRYVKGEHFIELTERYLLHKKWSLLNDFQRMCCAFDQENEFDSFRVGLGTTPSIMSTSAPKCSRWKSAIRNCVYWFSTHKNMENSKYVFVNFEIPFSSCAIWRLIGTRTEICVQSSSSKWVFTMNWLLHRMWFNLILPFFFFSSLELPICGASETESKCRRKEEWKSRAYWVKKMDVKIFFSYPLALVLESNLKQWMECVSC